MSSKSISSAAAKLAPLTNEVVRNAQDLAESSDRWLVAVASDLARFGGWMKEETGVITSSAAAAFGTTLGASQRWKEKWFERGRARPKSGAAQVELVTATAAAGPRSVIDQSRLTIPSEPGANNPAGVAPLLEVLGRVVTEHARNGYHSLQNDERFWKLVQLLDSLTHPKAENGSTAANRSQDPDPLRSVAQGVKK